MDATTPRLGPADELLVDWLSEHPDGYLHIEVKGDAGICCLHRFLFTWAILAGMHENGYVERWCYAGYDAAKAAYDAWDGSLEPDGWQTHPNTGRRRKDGDPGKEDVRR